MTGKRQTLIRNTIIVANSKEARKMVSEKKLNFTGGINGEKTKKDL